MVHLMYHTCYMESNSACDSQILFYFSNLMPLVPNTVTPHVALLWLILVLYSILFFGGLQRCLTAGAEILSRTHEALMHIHKRQSKSSSLGQTATSYMSLIAK